MTMIKARIGSRYLISLLVLGTLLSGCTRAKSDSEYVISEVVANVYFKYEQDFPPALNLNSSYKILKSAGPSVIEELLLMLHSSEPKRATFAKLILKDLVDGAEGPVWPELLPLIHKELLKKPNEKIAKNILSAIACKWLKGKKEFAHDALPYLYDETHVNSVGTVYDPAIPADIVEMRLCDYAARVIIFAMDMPGDHRKYHQFSRAERETLQKIVLSER